MPEIFFILNQNNVCSANIGEAELNNIIEIFPNSKQFALNQAYELKQLSKNEISMLPEDEHFVKKYPRK